MTKKACSKPFSYFTAHIWIKPLHYEQYIRHGIFVEEANNGNEMDSSKNLIP